MDPDRIKVLIAWLNAYIECDGADDDKPFISEIADTLKDAMEFKEKIQAELATWDQRMKSLEDSAKTTASQRDEMEAGIFTLLRTMRRVGL